MKKYKNILLINSGGGLGDTLQFIPIINFLNTRFKIENLFYFSNKNEFFFNNILKDIKPNNLKIIDFMEQDYGFRLVHLLKSKEILKKLNIKKFDLIIDNQTRFINSLVFKLIKHDEYISPCLNYKFSKPYFRINKEKNIVKRILNYFEKKMKKKINIKYQIKNIPKKYIAEANRLTISKKPYIGFSITAGHPSRQRHFELIEIINVAKFYQKKFIPMFFIEKKYKKIIKIIKKKLPNAYFPELKARKEFQNPVLVTALANKTKFCITINNGIMHMLALSKSKLFIFFDENSRKFQPLSKNVKTYECDKQKTKINDLKTKDILNFVKINYNNRH